MDTNKRDELERKYRPHLFGDCSNCGDENIHFSTHECDPEQVEAYWDAKTPKRVPNAALIEVLGATIQQVFKENGLNPLDNTKLIDELAVSIEPLCGGPFASAASGY